MALTLDQQLQVTRDFLKMLQNAWIGVGQIENFLNYFAVPAEDLEARIFILTRLLEVSRDISLKAFASEESRTRTIETIQSALDRYIKEEDEITDEPE